MAHTSSSWCKPEDFPRPRSVFEYPSPQLAESPSPLPALRWAPEGPACVTPPGLQHALREPDGVGQPMAWGSFTTPAKAQRPPQPRLKQHLPASPPRGQRSRAKIRRLRSSSRASSLLEDKILAQSALVKSHSSFKLLDHFVLEGRIGQSETSEVFRARHRSSGALFAIKRLSRRFVSKAHRDRCLQEMLATTSLPEHARIVAYYRAWQQAEHFYIQMALCQGGSLADALAQAAAGGRTLSEPRVWCVLRDLCEGLAFLHAHRTVHLDIKPANVFLDAAGRCKIGDFGLAIKESEKEWEEGDGDYLAPELLAGREPTAAADVFSAGATLFECCTGRTVAGAREQAQRAELGVSPPLQALLRSMLDPCPERRPTAAEALEQAEAALARLPGLQAACGLGCCSPAAPPPAQPEAGAGPLPATPQGTPLQPGWQCTPPQLRPALPAPPTSGLPTQLGRAQSRCSPRGGKAACRLLDTAWRSPGGQAPRGHWSRQPIRFPLGDGEGPPSPASWSGTPAAPRPDIAASRPFTAMKTPFAAPRYQSDSCGSSECSLSWASGCGDGSSGESGAVDDLRSTVAMLSMAGAAAPG